MLFKKKNKSVGCVVDVHSHILPGIDDGSRNLDETLKMLEISHNEGITHIIATPHFKDRHNNAKPDEVKELINNIQGLSDKYGLDINIYQGNEILYYDDMCKFIEKGGISTINGSNYVLVEFITSASYQYIRNALEEIMSEGYQPIVAHVERYSCMVQNIKNVFEIKNMGVEIQVNASSITGDNGKDVKRFVHKLLHEQIIDYVGTDCHRCEGRRIPKMKECINIMYKKYNEQYINDILYKNAINRLL